MSSTPIRLVAGDVLRLEASDPRFEFRRHDVLEPFDTQVALVRAMNILNPDYFDRPSLQRAIGHIHRSIVPGGLFATGSNEDAGSAVDGAIYERTDGGFRRLSTSGQGSPVDDLVTDAGTLLTPLTPAP